ncbi:MAG: oxygenase MpaB family protein [bacterium]
MVGTLVEFSAFIILGARRLGFRVADEEAQGLVHLWRYAGHLGGVHPTSPRTSTPRPPGAPGAADQGGAARPDADSIALTHAMRHTITEGARGRRERLAAALVLRYHDGLSWALNAPPIAADLQVPHRAWRHAVPLGRPVIGAVELARSVVPGLGDRLAQAGRAATAADVAGMLAGELPAYHARRV